jgi:hypothetical protein
MGKSRIPPQPILTGFFPCHPLPPTGTKLSRTPLKFEPGDLMFDGVEKGGIFPLIWQGRKGKLYIGLAPLLGNFNRLESFDKKP